MHDILDIDHLMCGIADRDVARRAYARLGFTITPFSHTTGFGAGNQCVLMHPYTPGCANYLELISITEPEKLNPMMRALLSGADGIKTIVNAVANAEVARESQVAAGFDMLPVWPISRPWTLDDGRELTVSFAVVLPKPGQSPLMFNGCQHLTVEHYYREEWRNHPNGALSLACVTGVLQDLRAGVDYFERVYGAEASWQGSDIAVLRAAGVALRLVSAAGLAQLFPAEAISADRRPPYTAGFTIVVESLDRAAKLLRANGVRSFSTASSIIVPPSETCGSVMELRDDQKAGAAS